MNLKPKTPSSDVLGYNFEKILPYLKSSPLNLSNDNISFKNKNIQVWHQKYLVWVFWAEILKILSYLKSALSNLPNDKVLRNNKNS